MTETSVQHCFLLTHSFRDTATGFEIELFAQNADGAAVRMVITSFRPLFFVSRSVSPRLTASAVERKELPLRSLSGAPVDCCYFTRYAAMQECAAALREQSSMLFESDVHPVDRFLMERGVAGDFYAKGPVDTSGTLLQMRNPRIRGGGTTLQPSLSVLSVDIETNVSAGTLYSIACAGKTDIVFIKGSGEQHNGIVFCASEQELLERFFAHITQEDPDIIIGWNVIDFDLLFLYERCRSLGIPFRMGRGGANGSVFPVRSGTHHIARLPGRVVIDVPIQLRTYYRSFEEYSLNHVAAELLGKQKEITLSGKEKIAEIDRQYTTDIIAFARYNLQDARLTREVFDTTGLLPNAVERSRRSGHLLDRVGGSIAAFDYLYLPRLHRAGFVANDADAAGRYSTEALPGGFVLEPDPGIYDNVLVLDFRSLYPSIIMSFAIDPLGRFLATRSTETVTGPSGTPFSRSPALLPTIITELLDARMEAKKAGNGPLSQAIKILMNSFYGVLGARNCRFFSPEIAKAITRTGQYILKTSISHIEQSLGYRVIYGDTDSLFVHLGAGRETEAEKIGHSLADQVTAFLDRHLKEQFAASSALLLQFENHFRHFLIPAVRGASHGSKKHYCGGKVENGTLSLHFKGMESARTDWTDLAKELQQELIRSIFTGAPVDDFLLRTISDVKAGKVDHKLIYKKRLRKNMSEYTHAVPPHVQAARLLDDPPHLIRYCITVDGPQPPLKLTAPLDYQHYIDAQLQPIADTVLELVGKSFSGIVSGQQDLFSD